MYTRTLLNLSLPALLLAGATVAVASARDSAADAKQAAKVARKSEHAMTKRRTADAIAFAEQAVELSPNDAGYRALLGQAYLRAGRFTSARESFEEAVQLDPRNGRAALSLVLAQIATGDWSVARRTLDAHADKIAAGDAGLAIALAGDPASAVGLLTQAARQPGAGPKVRQNLALSLALAGQWQAARVVAAADMSPADVDARMVEWAAFAQPRAASDQVAYLLGVLAAQDAGRPVALALNAPAAPVTVTPAAPVEVASSPEPTAEPGFARVVFAPQQEVVQALPVQTIRPATVAAKVPLTRAPQPLPVRAASMTPKLRVAAKPAASVVRSGTWHVQLGAFDSAEVAREAWSRATRRYAALQGHRPAGMTFTSGGRSFYRLSVGGFAQEDAQAMCRRYQSRGGTCFVRQGAGDQAASWVRRPGVQLASR